MTRKTATLLVTASALALGTHSAQAAEVIFSNSGQSEVQLGERVTQTSGVTQIKLDNGAMLSFVDGAEFQINADGTVDLFSGSVTVTGGPDGMAIVRMPDGAQGQVSGIANAASFTVDEDGDSAGHTLTGAVTVLRGRSEREFREGEFWESSGRRGLRQVAAKAPSATPDGPVEIADMKEDGPVAAAQNGLPVSLGDGLAAAGASSDIVAAARNVDLAAGNPSLDTFPTGDLALLVAAAADLEGLNGGTPFPAAQADIIRAYLGFLADGGSGAQFLTSYAGFLTNYLDLIRAGNLPSTFDLASLSDINAYLGYADRTGAIDDLAAADQVLADRYLAFLAGGGNVDQFAATFTDLVNAYFEFVRAGGDPDSFGGASQTVLDDYIAFLAASGLEQQLSDPDQVLVAAYNANGGLQFARDFQTALAAYFSFLETGNLPSGFAETDLAVLQDYLEQLAAAGLLGEFLGDQADFYADYLAFVQAGGNPDDFAALNANIFAGYAADLNAYYDYLLNGGAPSAYQPLSQAQIAAFVAALEAQGATPRFLDDLAGFYTDYAAFLAEGGDPDVFTGLPVLNLPAFADALNAYAAFLGNGGLPTAFAETELDVLANYVAALDAAGQTGDLLGANADLIEAYFAFLANGGATDLFPGLPLYAGYVDALDDYFAFLGNGGLPADYDALTQAQIQDFLTALGNAGGLASQLGDQAGFYADYLAFVGAGNDPATFAGLPLYATYVDALNDYFDFLAGGGLPADFGGLSEQVIAQYLAALSGVVGGLDAYDELDMFADDYAAFVLGGGDPAAFAGLPIYADYVAALNQYFAFLAGSGLPADFTGLDQATIDAYLAALSGVTGGLGAYANLDAFADGYAAFVLGGGNPEEFAGLPIYATYVAALNDYFAFLTGGGLPADFTGLDQATVDAYLAALSGVTGGLDAFGALNGNFDDYIAFLLGGGDPEQFAGLPVYAGYVTALNDYFAFLAGGGLPADYTLLDEATIEAYLAALTNVTGGLDSFNGLNSFFAAYSAFVLGGGDPEDFAGLPIYADYLTAISEFYAFLLGGGLPSEFTGLSAQEVEDYLAALEGAGLLSTTFDGEVLTFFNDYLAFITGGGVPDQFGGLPDGLINTFGDFYAAQFSPNASRAGAATAVALEDDGQITAITFATGVALTYPDGGQTLQEHGRIGNTVAWSRYQGGTAAGGVTNDNDHLLVGSPAINLPASGTVQYALVGGTAPTDAFAANGETGFFDGDLAVAFGATSRVGLDFDVFADTRGWNVQTQGGVANPENSGLIVQADGSFASNNQSVSIDGTAGGACGGFCSVNVLGSLFGEGATHAGFNFQLDDQTIISNRAIIQGTAVFAAGGTAIDGLGTMPDNTPQGMGTPLILDNADQFSDTSSVIIGFAAPFDNEDQPILQTSNNGTITADPNGAVSVLDAPFLKLNNGDTTITDVSGNALHLIGRWTDGTVDSNFYTELEYSTAQSAHYFVAAPVGSGFTVPTTGTVTYDLLAATAPTVKDGLQAPGQFTGGMSLLFGTSEIKLGFEAQLTIPDPAGDFVYDIATVGGVANPENSFSFLTTFGDSNERFNFTLSDGNITASDGSCTGTTADCRFRAEGAFAGDDVGQLGFAYNLFHPGRDGGQSVSGSAIFGTDEDLGGGGNTGGGSDPLVTTYLGGFPNGTGRAYATDGGNSQPSSESPTLDANGALVSAGNLSPNTASVVDVAGDAKAVLGRFTDGSATYRGNNINLPLNDGLPYIALAPVVGSLPTTGTINYEVFAATQPVFNNGESAPGTFEGALSLRFGTGIEFRTNGTITMPEAGGDVAYTFASAGFDDGDFVNAIVSGPNEVILSGSVFGLGRGCSGSGCTIQFYGGFAGENPEERLGLTYQVFPGTFSAPRIQGAVIYAPEGTSPPTTSSAPQTTQDIATIAAAPEAYWDRWSVSDAAALTSGTDMAIAPGIEALRARGIQFSPEQLQRLEAHMARQAR